MKKIIAFILCAILLISVTSVVAFAEDGDSAPVEQNPSVTDELPTTEGTVTEGENSAPETIPGSETEEPKASVTEVIVNFFKNNFEEISVIVTLICGAIYEIRKHKKLNGSIGTLNNNAIAVAENSANAMKDVLKEAQDIASVVNNYKDEIALLLNEIRKSAEEKQSLEDTLKNVETFLKTAKIATLELSNEVAELLVLANIPNSKKEELYARHTKAVNELKAAEEVMSNDDGTKA